jgi:hypothetical protein
VSGFGFINRVGDGAAATCIDGAGILFTADGDFSGFFSTVVCLPFLSVMGVATR